ncbi:DUF427 domain-containing protein [Nakamurella leprariae]|uniref:DUF427 domain-containing protein n=1 Tax=Nakamurella leprariae TaxID=2803911 RepID=A0A938YHP3_9ACTN|nr:DUF427 domain-containing protein [Nakamurella leprariae]MBM9468329.1 DUF427 domain-containing protein [Nakamurella leprariae]
MKIPGPSHPITIDPTVGRVTVRSGDDVIAETGRALTLQESDYPPVLYVPLEDVRPDRLRPSSSTSHCPYKGDASYYDLVTVDGVVSDAVWSYREPYPAVAEIAGRVAFYPEHVTIAVGD